MHSPRPATHVAVERLEQRNLFATFLVSTSAGAGPGSLRQAIQDANFNPGADMIEFNIGGGGHHTIAAGTPMPHILDTVEIDATTQPGFAGQPLIELSGMNAPSVDGLVIETPASSRSVIRGLNLNRWHGAAVRIALGSDNNHVVGNWIGTDQTGMFPAPNDTGVLIRGAGPSNFVGGTATADRNVISGNHFEGIRVEFTNNTGIKNNYIGTNFTGTGAVPNARGIVMVNANASALGGHLPGEGNVISGNFNEGILLTGGSALLVQGNYIGAGASGTGAIPNLIGLLVAGGSGHSIGGPIAGQGNVIAHNNATGINLGGEGHQVMGNRIGVDAANNPAGNGGDGILITGFNNVVGEAGPNLPNVIAYNGGAGIAVSGNAAEENALRRNSIFANGGLGIDLTNPLGPNPNDPLDADAGPNFNQNYPVITSATTSSSGTTITGTLHSTPNRSFVIELFANVLADPSGFGEGERFLGDITLTTDAAGNASFSLTVAAVPVGQFITSTATESSGNTSEFSAAHAVVAAPLPPPDDGKKDKKNKKDKDK